jgi:hypothetical protein
MNKIITIIVFTFFITCTSQASKNGSGELKIQDDMINAMLKWYWNPKNKSDRPSGLAITKDGDMIGFSVCPARYAGDCIIRDLEPLKYCRQNVKKYLKKKENCWMFAKRRKIVWNNLNVEISKGSSNQEIKEILSRYGFYGDLKNTSKSNEATDKIIKNSSDVTEQLKQLKKLLDDGIITQDEFKKAKKKILN